VLVSRAQPEPVNVEKSPFLTEVDIAEVKVVEAVGGFALQVRFDQHGAWLLEQYSGGNPGRRFAIFSMFGEKPVQSRWIAAPVIPRRIADGTLVFTPDASREEAEQIAAGLNHLAHKTQPRSQ
jgi:preprotein translocase subunit SecD